MNIIFQIDGGIGKSIAATAVCKAIKAQYPEDNLIVITGYPDVFLCNPNVDKAFSHADLRYFYEEYIENKEVKMMLHNPYLETSFINQKEHLNETWCNMFGIKYNGEQPEIFLNSREAGFYSNMFTSDKPIFVIQTNGGGQDQANKYSWTRDLPIGTAQQIVNAMTDKYNVVHIRREDQLPLQNATPIQKNFRALATLLLMSEKRLLIDSFAQHTAAALGLPSVVCWIGNSPKQFGYDIHTNIIAKAPTLKPELRHSVFSKYNISGDPTEFPYFAEAEIFDPQQIFDALIATPKILNTNNASIATNNNIPHQASQESVKEKVKEHQKTEVKQNEKKPTMPGIVK